MIEYAVYQCKGKADQAVDILRSGSAQPGISGIDRGRLQIAMATVEAERGNWAEVLTHASASKTALHSEEMLTLDAEPSLVKTQLKMLSHVQLMGVSRAVRALLAQGEDKLALDVASMQVKRSSAQLSQSSHPDSRVTAAAAFTALQMHNSIYTPSGGAGPAPLEGTDAHEQGEVCLAGVHKAVGDWHVYEERGEVATASYTKALELATAAATASPSSSQSADGSRLLQGALYLKEVEADALLGLAQQDILREDWPKAETRLAAALEAAEAAGSDAHPRLAPILTQLGWVYSRTARVTYAEGLFREAAKLMKLDPTRVTQLLYPLMDSESISEAAEAESESKGQAGSVAEAGSGEGKEAAGAALLLRQQQLRKAAASATLVHPSLAALLCWRYCQLLTALPKREREADTWGRCAVMLWHSTRDASAGVSLETLSETDIEATFGSRGRLKGAGHSGSGVILSIAMLRSLDGQL
ncbi:MAG: hypothetical protein WDW38_002949 [Sanguina aurantia]